MATLEEALKMLEAANSIIQSQQKEISDQQLKIDAQASVIVSKDSQLKKKDLEIKAKQKEIEQKNLEIIQLQEKFATQLRYRFCARTEKSDNQPSLFDFEDEAFIPSEEEKHCACGAELVKVGEDRSERLQVIQAQIYVEVTVRPKYACGVCEKEAEMKIILYSVSCLLQRTSFKNQFQHRTFLHLSLHRSSVNIIHTTDSQKLLKGV